MKERQLLYCGFFLSLLLGSFSCSPRLDIDDIPVKNTNNLNDDPYDEISQSVGFLNLWTPNNVEVTSKEVYIDSVELVLIDKEGNISLSSKTKIKGRGNSTWYSAPKKPYALKLYKKEALLGYPSDKSWVLLANYYDPVFLRNGIASFIGRRLSCLSFTPHFSFVNLTLNDEYKGLYQLGEKIKIGKGRVNIVDNGFILEVDGKATLSEPTFSTLHLNSVINVKDPDVTVGDEDFNWVRDYVCKAEDVLYSDSFLDEDEGYKKYFDIDTFVDWYLINEIAKNADACMYASCFMNIQKGEKLKMGPIWDFDLAFGNYIYNLPHTVLVNSPEGFWIKDKPWFERFFLDPVFCDKIYNRFIFFFNNRDHIYEFIDSQASIVQQYIAKDNAVWGRISSEICDEESLTDLYFKSVIDLKNWIEQRFQWMNNELLSEKGYSKYGDYSN